jgi:hypothetical protein
MSSEVMTMRTVGYLFGYLTVVDAFRLLEAGIPVYIVAAPSETNALPLQGGWKDDEGKVHLECACICLSSEKAYEIGRLYNQECILRLYPTANGDSEAYLLKDTPFARQVALDLAGGYTGDGEYLLVGVKGDASPFSEAYEDWTPVDLDFLPVK